MDIILQILRRDGYEQPSYLQRFEICVPRTATVARAIAELNARQPLIDINGKTTHPVAWNCGCQQKTCGVCAMVINGKPMLACAAFIEDLTSSQKTISIEPLSKFPVIRDLVVDTSLLEEKMLEAQAFISGPPEVDVVRDSKLMEVSRCMLCGCCYEVCPNCLPNGPFVGPAAMHGALRAAWQEPTESRRKHIQDTIQKKGKRHCSRVLSCQVVCPVNISITRTLTNS